MRTSDPQPPAAEFVASGRRCEVCGRASRPRNIYCTRCGHVLGDGNDTRVPGVDELLEGEVATFTADVSARQRNTTVAWLLWSLAPLGAPRFYMGRPGQGTVVLLLVTLAFALLAVGVSAIPHHVNLGLVLGATWAIEAWCLRDMIHEDHNLSEWEALLEIDRTRRETADKLTRERRPTRQSASTHR